MLLLALLEDLLDLWKANEAMVEISWDIVLIAVLK